MSQQLLYPAGYIISISTWENDGDNSRTDTVSGLTERQVEILVGVCRIFASRNDYQKGSNNIGNMYDPSEDEINKAGKILLDTLTSLGVKGEKERQTDEEHEEYEDDWNYAESLFYNEIKHEFYDLGLTKGEFFTRVVETITVSFVEKPIFVENVNAKFGV